MHGFQIAAGVAYAAVAAQLLTSFELGQWTVDAYKKYVEVTDALYQYI
jgi:hypothetical protein